MGAIWAHIKYFTLKKKEKKKNLKKNVDVDDMKKTRLTLIFFF